MAPVTHPMAAPDQPDAMLTLNPEPYPQTRLVFEAGQLKGAILMSFPDRIHTLQRSTYGAPAGLERPLDDAAWAQVGKG